MKNLNEISEKEFKDFLKKKELVHDPTMRHFHDDLLQRAAWFATISEEVQINSKKVRFNDEIDHQISGLKQAHKRKNQEMNEFRNMAFDEYGFNSRASKKEWSTRAVTEFNGELGKLNRSQIGIIRGLARRSGFKWVGSLWEKQIGKQMVKEHALVEDRVLQFNIEQKSEKILIDDKVVHLEREKKEVLSNDQLYANYKVTHQRFQELIKAVESQEYKFRREYNSLNAAEILKLGEIKASYIEKDIRAEAYIVGLNASYADHYTNRNAEFEQRDRHVAKADQIQKGLDIGKDVSKEASKNMVR